MLKIFSFLGFFFLLSCKNAKPRRPINAGPSWTIFQDNIETTKHLIQVEERQIFDYISTDSLGNYQSSDNGFWYSYDTVIKESKAKPKAGDLAIFEYDIRSLDDTVIYSKASLGIKKYRVDKEDFITGIQRGIKLMKIGETITFIIPSYSAFGISGDGHKIGINATLKSTVTLLNIIN